MRRSFGTAGALLAGLLLCGAGAPQGGPGAVKAATGILTGTVAIRDEGPMMEGSVIIFKAESGPPPSATRYWRVPTDAFRLDENARFVAVLPEGNYYLGAIERPPDEALGPPREDDYFFIDRDAKGRPKLRKVRAGSMVDLGVLYASKRFKRASLAKKGITAIEGIIRDAQGRPVAGMVVFAFKRPAADDRPLFVSERTDKKGRYRLRLAGGGSYYLRARKNYGGPPSGDELMGEARSGKPVTVTKSEKKTGVNITVVPGGGAAPRPQR